MQIRPKDLIALDGGKYARRDSMSRRVLIVTLNLAIGTGLGYFVGAWLHMVLTYAVLGFIMAVLISVIASEGDTR